MNSPVLLGGLALQWFQTYSSQRASIRIVLPEAAKSELSCRGGESGVLSRPDPTTTFTFAAGHVNKPIRSIFSGYWFLPSSVNPRLHGEPSDSTITNPQNAYRILASKSFPPPHLPTTSERTLKDQLRKTFCGGKLRELQSPF